MRFNIRQVLKYVTMGIGIALMGILLIPTGILLIFLSVVWKTIDRIIRVLEKNSQET